MPVSAQALRRGLHAVLHPETAVVTGEEDDDMLHSARSKLFVMSKGAWVERGTGVLKLNATKDSGKSGARLRMFPLFSFDSLCIFSADCRDVIAVMRADATHRLLLNATLFSKFSIEVNQEKYVRFAIIEGSEPISYMLRVRLLFLSLSLFRVVVWRSDRGPPVADVGSCQRSEPRTGR